MPRLPSDQESLADLRDTVHDLAGQVQILREVLDEIREHIHWAVTNDRLVIQIVGSSPSQAGTPEAVSPETAPPTTPAHPPHSGRHTQSTLFR
jgi:hypothetical protein